MHAFQAVLTEAPLDNEDNELVCRAFAAVWAVEHLLVYAKNNARTLGPYTCAETRSGISEQRGIHVPHAVRRAATLW